MTTDDINPAEAVAFCEVLMAAFDTLIAEFRTAAGGTLRRMYEAEVVADKIEAQRAIALMVPLHVPDAPAELRTARARVAALEAGAAERDALLLEAAGMLDAYLEECSLMVLYDGQGNSRNSEDVSRACHATLTAAAPTAAADTGECRDCEHSGPCYCDEIVNE